MKSTFATLALVGAAAAAPHAGHAAFHKKDLDLGNLLGGAVKDLTTLASDGAKFISSIKTGDGKSILAAINSEERSGSFIGEATSGDAVTNTIINKSGKDATWFCWGDSAAWDLTTVAPALAVAVPDGQNVTVSHSLSTDKNSGACAPMFEGDGLNFAGMANQAWMEFTFVNDEWSSSTWDLSMEVNSNGHNMTIAGDECTSDLERCSFHCNDASATSCGEAGTYFLKNCAVGSQPKAQEGTYFGQATGGCSGIKNSGISKLITTLH